MSILQTILDGLDRILEHASFVAIFLGLAISLAGTQWVKRAMPWKHRWVIRAVGLPLGFFPTWALWPADRPDGWAWGLAVGFGAPWVYKGVMSLVYWKWPQLEERLSAHPRQRQQET